MLSQKDLPRVSVVVPVYNERVSIQEIIERIRSPLGNELASSLGLGWRLPSQWGGGINRNQVAPSLGTEWRIPPEYASHLANTSSACE